ncbi:MAG TPA: HAD-IIIC family phosphatase [Solirubrobacteraceae bacterium]|jgi:FkbH-like protein|nr:HAD-IIIC family phosphatase [Solirubrobacteraceae bacterium]
MSNGRAPIPRPVKLVIWDLDDTLWQGTLSEGPVVVAADRAPLIRELNLRGIVSSISSKNNLADVRERLQAEGMWDQFVFPSVNWQPKGRQIANIITDMQLRPENVLFIDDNQLNLQEAEHYAPGVMLASPAVIETMLEHPHLQGKADPKLARLAQYRVLEEKARDRAAASDTSNEDFLAACDIHVYLGDDCDAQSVRLVDLANRSNQLNFTKGRYTQDEFDSFLDEPDRITRYVHVRDKYGDYGIVGFYSMKGGRLDELVFSCRTMNMGIEQWVYAHLGRPPLMVNGEVASDLDAPDVTWIELDDTPPEASTTAAPGAATHGVPSGSNGRILLKGGCDLSVLADLLTGGDIVSEFNYVNDAGQLVQRHHTETLRRATAETIERYGDVVDRLPIADREGFTSLLRTEGERFDTVIYSLILDYTQNLYRLRGTDFVQPFEQMHIDVTDPRNWARVLKTHAANNVSEEDLGWFADNFEPCGPLSEEQFKANVKWMCSLHPETRFVLLNAPEIPVVNEMEPDRHLHHMVLNRALDEVVAEIPNAVICDLRGIVTSPADITLNIRHYTRNVFMKIARTLPELVERELAVATPTVRQRARLVLRDMRSKAHTVMRERIGV